MKVFTECPHCSTEFAEKTLCDTKKELTQEKGKSFDTTCVGCGKQFSIKVKDLKARKSGAAALAALIIFGICLPFAAYLIWKMGLVGFTYISITGVIVIPIVAFVMINKQEQVRVESFNSSLKK